ncbi:MAG TPA: selenoneine biosynthesis selenosugar synthase SenB [Casimicrobiaceae bacterium]|nr:selenoneine biosynthesis selenosugar synthase SenB [Casimicrobiaceae bacterium]
MPSRKPKLLLVTPSLADANNGNWQTAARWSRLVAPDWQSIVQRPDEPVTGRRVDDARLMVALHARRSRRAIAAWRRLLRPLVVVLTGTDVYRDVPERDGDALASLDDADRLVVLQEDALAHLAQRHRAKARVVHQSARALAPFAGKSAHRLHVLLVAHLREEKDPRTLVDAWRRVPLDVPASLTIIGDALDASLGRAVQALARDDARVQWLGPRPHAWTRQAIKRAHAIVVPSRMEGGANVVVEAVTSGTPVLASRVSGNVGMLGRDYAGYFPAGDAPALAQRIVELHADRAVLAHLEAQCARRAPLFAPQAERAALLRVLAETDARARSGS